MRIETLVQTHQPIHHIAQIATETWQGIRATDNLTEPTYSKIQIYGIGITRVRMSNENMNGRDLINKVLITAQEPLSARDIWNIAVKKKYDKLYGSGNDNEQKKNQISSELGTWSKEEGSPLGRHDKGYKGNKYITYFLQLPVIAIDKGNRKPEESKTVIPKKIFVAKSFDSSDDEINSYVTGILDSLKIKHETGERYDLGSITDKVKTRIRESNIFILILVKRDKIEGGGYTASPWLMKEYGFAQRNNNEVIAWVENEIKDKGGLGLDNELIQFTRDNLKDMEKATLKFLEALKCHDLI